MRSEVFFKRREYIVFLKKGEVEFFSYFILPIPSYSLFSTSYSLLPNTIIFSKINALCGKYRLVVLILTFLISDYEILWRTA